MMWIRPIAFLMLTLSIAFAGFPAQAKPQCPMAGMQMTMQAMKAHDCDGCAKEKQKENNCCKNMGCNASCTGSGSLVKNLPSPAAPISYADISTGAYHATGGVIPLHLLSGNDRPPKSLA